MERYDLTLRELMLEKRREKPACVHKKWVTFSAGAKAFFTDLFIALQLAVLAFIYAFFAYVFPVFFYISVFLTLCSAVHVLVCERDGQIKSSWIFLFFISFGCGYIIYFLADRRICYGYDSKRFASISEKMKPYVPEYAPNTASPAVKGDCEYMYKAGGLAPYSGTDLKYFDNAKSFFDNVLARLECAEKFIFIEFFIINEGVLLERFFSVLKRKVKEGVSVRILYDDVGCAGVLTSKTKKRFAEAGIKLKVFTGLFTLFGFGLNYRDHRKIIVVDGKTGYTGGCNISDNCINGYKMQGLWKDSGVRLDGSAVDGLSLQFMKMWEFAVKENLRYSDYLGLYEKTGNVSTVVPYAGGPELSEALCRGVYANAIAGAREKIYIMTPYFVPDGAFISQLKEKAMSGVDVRLVLPAVPDYNYIYRITKSNADKLIKYGVKVYYMNGAFVHGKVMLTENCTAVGSVNTDMRAFFQEFDNGVYTDDKQFMREVGGDFESVFANNTPHIYKKDGVINTLIASVLRIVSTLM